MKSPVASSFRQMSKVATVAVLLVIPVPPFADVIGPVVLFLTPDVVSFTSTLKVQLPPAATMPPLKFRLVSPVAGMNVPPQVSVVFGGAATIMPLGKVSVNPTPVSATVALGLVMVKLIVTTPLSGATVLENDLVIVGGATTVIWALAVPPLPVLVPPLAEVTLPVVLFFTPAVVPVTVTLNMQLPPWAMAAPLSTIWFGAVVVRLPAHVVVGPVLATVNPPGKVSVKPTAVNTTVPFGLVMVKVSEVLPPNGMVAAPNALL